MLYFRIMTSKSHDNFINHGNPLHFARRVKYGDTPDGARATTAYVRRLPYLPHGRR